MIIQLAHDQTVPENVVITHEGKSFYKFCLLQSNQQSKCQGKKVH